MMNINETITPMSISHGHGVGDRIMYGEPIWSRCGNGKGNGNGNSYGSGNIKGNGEGNGYRGGSGNGEGNGSGKGSGKGYGVARESSDGWCINIPDNHTNN